MSSSATGVGMTICFLGAILLILTQKSSQKFGDVLGIGMGVIKYSGDKAIGKMADVVNKKLHGCIRHGKEIPPLPANHRLWKETDRNTGEKIFQAMTTK